MEPARQAGDRRGEPVARRGRRRSVTEDLGRSLELASTGGVCDGNILQDAGLPTLDTLGVSAAATSTATDEYVETESLV